jgi:hypothetical protein
MGRIGGSRRSRALRSSREDDGEFEDPERAEPREAPDDLTRGGSALRFIARGDRDESHRPTGTETGDETTGEAADDTAGEKAPDPRKKVEP